MGDRLGTTVLLGLLEAAPTGVTGQELQAMLRRHGTDLQADRLYGALLRLETIDHVAVARGEQLRFALTDAGRARAYELAGGRAVSVRLLMADLVGYVAFTAAHGDEAAHTAARQLAAVATAAVSAQRGEVVKGLGDGFLAWMPPAADAARAMADITAGFLADGGEPGAPGWQLRAATHLGQPIRCGGDLFGNDVNLVARLCAAAAPGELICSAPDDPEAEALAVRGVARPVPVRRMVIA